MKRNRFKKKGYSSFLRGAGLSLLLFSFISINLASLWMDIFDVEIEEQLEISEKDISEKEFEEKAQDNIKDLYILSLDETLMVSQTSVNTIHDIASYQLVYIDIPTPPPDLA